MQLGSDKWTALIALASASDLPPPPPELGEIWRDQNKAISFQQKISKDQIERRKRDQLEILRLLISHRCNVDDDDGFGATALYKAADRSQADMVQGLLEYGANPNVKTRPYIDGASDVTPLHVGVKSKAVMELLLRHGADASAKDSEGETAADWSKLEPGRDYDLIKDGTRWKLVDRK